MGNVGPLNGARKDWWPSTGESPRVDHRAIDVEGDPMLPDDARHSEPCDLPPAVFTVDRGGGAGLTYKKSRGQGYVAPSRGVRRRIETLADRECDLLAAAAGCVDGAVVTDVAAAHHWNLPLPWDLMRAGGTVSMAVSPGSTRPKRAGVRGRRLRLPPFHVTEHRGILVTTPARTWLDCAALLSLADLVAMGDAILHRLMATEGEFQHLLTWGFRRRGMANVRRAVPILDGRAESPGESWARTLLVQAGLPAPACNVDVLEGDRWLARVDMLWFEQRVIVEYDGGGHVDERQRRRDAERLNALQAAGWLVIILTADDLRRPRQTVALVRRALSRPS